MSLSKITEIVSKRNLIVALILIVSATAMGLLYNWLLPDSLSLIYEKKITAKIDDSLLFQNKTQPKDSNNASSVGNAQIITEKTAKDTLLVQKKSADINNTNIQDNQVQNSLFNTDFKTVTYEQMLKIMNNSDFIIIDARQQDQYLKGHIPNAVNIFALDEPNNKVPKIYDLNPNKKIIVYCDGGNCDLSHALAKELRDIFGFKQVLLYEAGWEEWSHKYNK